MKKNNVISHLNINGQDIPLKLQLGPIIACFISAQLLWSHNKYGLLYIGFIPNFCIDHFASITAFQLETRFTCAE